MGFRRRNQERRQGTGGARQDMRRRLGAGAQMPRRLDTSPPGRSRSGAGRRVSAHHYLGSEGWGP